MRLLAWSPWWSLIAAIGAALFLSLGSFAWLKWHGCCINRSESVPVGLYCMRPPTQIHVGDFVLIDTPVEVAELLANHGWLPRGVPMLKPVAALAGDVYCVMEDGLSINGSWVGPIHLSFNGLLLPQLQEGCQRLDGDQVFLASDRPYSFDSRYFGPIARERILGIATPFITW